MTGKPVTARDQARIDNSPPLQGRGRGWGLAAGKLDQLQERGRHMRNEATGPEKRLWAHLSRSQLGGYKFRRQAVIGAAIADFLCPAKALIVEVDGDTHDEAKDRVRDDKLAAFGFRVIRVTNENVLTHVEGVVALIATALAEQPDRWPDSPHPNPSPEEEGLKEGISLEGSVG